jgi:hypothetical protein
VEAEEIAGRLPRPGEAWLPTGGAIEEIVDMKVRRSGVTAALLMLAAALATVGDARAQTHERGLSPEVRARLYDGRIAMIKAALRLDGGQLKLWAPLEERLRARFAAREQARAQRSRRSREREQWQERPAARASLADRLDRRSKRLAERAERAKALADTFRPFYASLSDEQKAVARVVLRPVLGGPRHHRRFMRSTSGRQAGDYANEYYR